MTLTVREAAATYEKAMRSVLPAGAGICATCHTFIDPNYSQCYACNNQPAYLDTVVPITYSEHLGQMHHVLRNYKDGFTKQTRTYMTLRLAAILWMFLERHEAHAAAAAGLSGGGFDIVTTVPSSTPERDEVRGNLRWIVGEGCRPTADRFDRVLSSTGDGPAGRDFHPDRYVAAGSVAGRDVLLIDDTWTRGGHAQSAGYALTHAKAERVGLVVIGRHVQPGWRPVPGGPTSKELLDELPKNFDWTSCCLE